MSGRVAAAVRGVRRAEIAEGRLRLLLENDLAAIAGGRREIAGHIADLALDAITLHRLEVLFEEVVSNIVRHGFQPGGAHLICVLVDPAADRVRFVFEDDGADFDPLSHPEPPRPADLATAEPGGLGLPLIRRLASDLRYERAAGVSRIFAGEFAPANRLFASILRAA